MDEDKKIEELAELFVVSATGVAAERDRALVEIEREMAAFAPNTPDSVLTLCSEIARKALEGAQELTSEDCIYAIYLRATYAVLVGKYMDCGSPYFTHHAAALLGLLDGRAAKEIKTRRELIASVDTMFDGAAPRAKREPTTPAPAPGE